MIINSLVFTYKTDLILKPFQGSTWQRDLEVSDVYSIKN